MQFEWTVFFGDAADAEARVYVLAAPVGYSADAASLEGLKITGRVEGPKCRYSHTLPARIPVRHRGVRTSDGNVGLGRAELVGEAIVPDPNFWTPELPFLYRAAVEVRRGDEVVASYEQDFGIRPLGVRGKRLVFGGKTWVPRAVRREVVVGEAPLELWRETATVMVVDDPDEELCREASEVGVVLFARVTSQKSLRDELRRFRQYAAVAVVLCDPARTMDDRISRDESRNLLLAQDGSASPLLETGRPTLQACVIDFSQSGVRFSEAFFAEVGAAIRVPVFAQRVVESCTLVEARAACDALQADLAGKCDSAGYIV